MTYLIDSNCFIEPFQRYYGFDVCPGFWDWIDRQNQDGVVFSIDRVAGELTGLGDELSDWAKKKDDTFFLPVDSGTLSSYATIVSWVNGEGFTTNAKSNFMKGADPFLIAHALAHGHAVVTHEIHEPKRKNKVKIPTVCLRFSVNYITLHDFLKTTGARFALVS